MTDKLTPFAEGEKAFAAGKKFSDCPYDETTETNANSDWKAGWEQAEEDLWETDYDEYDDEEEDADVEADANDPIAPPTDRASI